MNENHLNLNFAQELEEAEVAGAGFVSAAELRADCAVLVRDLVQRGAVTKDEAATQRPGGEKNPSTDVFAWLGFYRWLHRTHAVAGQRSAGPDMSREVADRDVLNALRGEPVSVSIPGRPADALPILVHAKSLSALMEVHRLDVLLSWLTNKHEILLKIQTAAALELIPRVLAEIARTYHLLCWIVTHPGPGLPYTEQASEAPTPPDWITELEPWDVIKIANGHHKHLLRVHAIRSLLDERVPREDPKSTRPSWSMWVASTAERFAEDPSVVMCDRSLASLLAASWLSAAAHTPPSSDTTSEGA